MNRYAHTSLQYEQKVLGILDCSCNLHRAQIFVLAVSRTVQ